jgi:hypothetical protein
MRGKVTGTWPVNDPPDQEGEPSRRCLPPGSPRSGTLVPARGSPGGSRLAGGACFRLAADAALMPFWDSRLDRTATSRLIDGMKLGRSMHCGRSAMLYSVRGSHTWPQTDSLTNAQGSGASPATCETVCPQWPVRTLGRQVEWPVSWCLDRSARDGWPAPRSPCARARGDCLPPWGAGSYSRIS